MAYHDPSTDPELRIRQLQRSLAALTKERDDLAKDVEQLCLSRCADATEYWNVAWLDDGSFLQCSVRACAQNAALR